jgi:hypothetical protein
MKNAIIFLSISIVLMACEPEKKVNQLRDLNADRQKLVETVIDKNQQIQDFERYLKVVEINMDKIREREAKLSRLQLSNKDEIQQDQLLTDLLVIGNILRENRTSIQSLQTTIFENQDELAVYQSTVSNLEASILQHMANFKNLEANITDLSIEITALRTHQDSLLYQMASLEDETHTAWFAYGNQKEMKENEVTLRKGGIFGLGGTDFLKEDFNREYFAQIDTRNTTEIPLFCDKATLASSHPTGSYDWNENEQIESLVITDPDLFWSTSKYLAIVVR